MNIKLADKVFGSGYVAKLDDGLLYVQYKLDPEFKGAERLSYSHNDKQYRMLIRCVTNLNEKANRMLNIPSDLYLLNCVTICEAIATGNTEKLVEIAESMLDENN